MTQNQSNAIFTPAFKRLKVIELKQKRIVLIAPRSAENELELRKFFQGVNLVAEYNSYAKP